MTRVSAKAPSYRTIARCLPVLPALMLGACAASGDYPSLAVRKAERVEGTADPAAAAANAIPTLPPASADLTTRLAGLLDVARKANASFTARQPSAEREIAAAGAVTSDSWTAAEVALADLQAARSNAVTAQGDLDQLYVDARAANPEQVSPSAAAIAAARDQVDGWVAAQDAVIARLSGRLKG